MPDRHVALESAYNFRDLGGYSGAGGRIVAWSRLYRADSLGALSESDLGALRELGLRTVVDLRTPAEVDERGRVREDAGVAYVHLPMIDVLPPSVELSRWAEPAYVADQYAGMLADGGTSIQAALEVVADPANHPVAYHCMAGKDRTGILSALVLGLLGVADEDVVADYALSRAAMERKLVRLQADHPERREYFDDAAAVVAAEPETMELFLAHLHAEYGGAAGWAAAVGLDGVAGQLRAALLDEVHPTV